MTVNEFDPAARKRGGRLFHVTCHAIDDLLAFGTVVEKNHMLHCLSRHLTSEDLRDAKNRPFRKLNDQVELICFNILDNHPHLVIEQLEPFGLDRYMRSVLTGYSMFFNRRHRRAGTLFRGSFDARWIQDGRHAKRAVAYVHLNHEVEQLRYPFSSHEIYVGNRAADWLARDKALELFGGLEGYVSYMEAHGPGILAEKAARRAAKGGIRARPTLLRGIGDHIPQQPNQPITPPKPSKV